jgi:hypothetical protein
MPKHGCSSEQIKQVHVPQAADLRCLVLMIAAPCNQPATLEVALS